MRYKLKGARPIGLMALGWLAALGLASRVEAQAPIPLTESVGYYATNGRRVAIEIYRPAANGRYPLLIGLYAKDANTEQPSQDKMLARYLAGNGYVLVLPHYLDATGTAPNPSHVVVAREFAVWQHSVDDALVYGLRLPGVDRRHVGLIGKGLGAFVGLAAAADDASHRKAIGAVVELSGGIKSPFIKMPPVLILHGDSDTVVPVARAYQLEHQMKAKNLPFEVNIYHGQGHSFGTMSAINAMGLMLSFLNAHLK